MSDMGQVIIPKSDQLNADDLLTGPKTIKITGVTVRGGQEQPVSIHYEGDDGKPYKSCKSMNRVLVMAWGPDSSKYVGRSLTLYCDPKVKWGGMEVGGIRISHMSDIDSKLTMALTVTRANKKPFTVLPLQKQNPAAQAPTGTEVKPLSDAAKPDAAGPVDTTPILRAFGKLGIDAPELEEIMGLPIAKWTAETVAEARDVYKSRSK